MEGQVITKSLRENSNANEAMIKWQVAVSNLTNAEIDLENWEDKAKKLEKDIQDWNDAKRLLELLKNHKLEKRKDFILNVVNSALVDIFQENYRLDILPRSQRGKSAAGVQKYDIIFYQNDIEIAKNEDLLQSNGGGVLSIASLFFKILIGFLYSGNKFYIFDESLSQVSPKYRARLSTFLRDFCDRYNFTLVVVSQTEELEIDAHLVYEVDSSLDKNKIPVLEVVHREGEIPEDGFFYSSITNFQSIKHQDFIYKGFTVIRGPNNSGKSATLRSIEAILFNNFQVDTYPRLNPGGKALTTEVVFGYVPTEQEVDEGKEQKEVGLVYKGKKVMFVINGKEYFGKSLASDKLKEAVEEIGFKYIDVKSMYKNFKGALKDQTERIAYTNQYDGLFLIGSKATDSEKIFSFLFNTENIALAIAHAKDYMLEMNKEFKDVDLRVIETKEKIRELTAQIEYYNRLYHWFLIHEYFDTEKKIHETKNIFEKINDKIKAVQNVADIFNSLLNIKTMKANIEQSINLIDYKKVEIKKVEDILSYIKGAQYIDEFLLLTSLIDEIKYQLTIMDKKIKLGEFSKYIDTKNTISLYKDRINKIDSILPYYSYTIKINEFLELKYAKELAYEDCAVNAMAREELDKAYQMCPCEQCSGTGVTIH